MRDSLSLFSLHETHARQSAKYYLLRSFRAVFKGLTGIFYKGSVAVWRPSRALVIGKFPVEMARVLMLAASAAVVSSSFLAPCSSFHASAPRAAVRMAAGSTYAEYTKGNNKGDGNKKGAQPPPADADFLTAAKEAAAGAGITQTPSEIVIAFNSWKLSLGRSYSSAEEEASDLRSFATNADMITQHLQVTREVAMASTPAPEQISVEFEGVDWRGVYNAASMARNSAEAEKAKAASGRTAANDKLRQAQATASQEEQKAYSMAQARTGRRPRPILSYPPILSHPILSYPILSYPILLHSIPPTTLRPSDVTPPPPLSPYPRAAHPRAPSPVCRRRTSRRSLRPGRWPRASALAWPRH